MPKQKKITTPPLLVETTSYPILRQTVRWLPRILFVMLVFVLGAMTTSAVIGAFVASLYLQIVSVHAQMTPGQIVDLVRSGRTAQVTQTGGRKNILLLGSDQIPNRDSDSILTDTIILASIGVNNGDVKLFSIPRDLWIASQSAKINALYSRDQSFAATIIGDITGLPIHNTLFIDTLTVGKIVDALGGVDIEVEQSFVDYQFPRMDVDVRKERDPKKLYEVIAFTKGTEHMSGDRVLRYIRSRHSSDPAEGTDDARVRRQQRVITALLAKLKDPMLAREPEILGKLLGLYTKDFDKQLPLTEISSLTLGMMQRHTLPVIMTYQLPVQGLSSDPALYHPEKFLTGAWVYLPVQSDYSGIRSLVERWIAK